MFDLVKKAPGQAQTRSGFGQCSNTAMHVHCSFKTKKDSFKTMALHYEEAFLLEFREWGKLKQRLEIIKLKLSVFLIDKFNNAFPANSMEDNQRLLESHPCEPVRQILVGVMWWQRKEEECKELLQYREKYMKKFHKLATRKHEQFMKASSL
jgi:hypothetical protein